MNTKTITFQNAIGEQLSARLELPDDEQPVAFALFAHCFTCSKDLKATVNISRAIWSLPTFPHTRPPRQRSSITG